MHKVFLCYYTGNISDLYSLMNKHINSSRLSGSTEKFGNHVFYYMQNQRQSSFFQILVFMKVANEQNLIFCEKLLQNKL